MQFNINIGIENTKYAAEIRTKVFIEEQKFNDEFDDIDKIAHHVIGFYENEPVATARFFAYKESEYKIGRIAVIKEMRGKNLGKEIVSFCESEIKKIGGTKISLSAQVRAKGFYQSLGYSCVGKEYLDEHVSHIMMEKYI